MFLVRIKKAKVAHIWTGDDTCCHMYNTGGLRKDKYSVVPDTNLVICNMCLVNFTRGINRWKTTAELNGGKQPV